jgi:hypothetical protein
MLDFIGDLAPFVIGVLAGVLFTTQAWYFGTALTVGYGLWFIRELWVDKARNVKIGK